MELVEGSRRAVNRVVWISVGIPSVPPRRGRGWSGSRSGWKRAARLLAQPARHEARRGAPHRRLQHHDAPPSAGAHRAGPAAPAWSYLRRAALQAPGAERRQRIVDRRQQHRSERRVRSWAAKGSAGRAPAGSGRRGLWRARRSAAHLSSPWASHPRRLPAPPPSSPRRRLHHWREAFADGAAVPVSEPSPFDATPTCAIQRPLTEVWRQGLLDGARTRGPGPRA